MASALLTINLSAMKRKGSSKQPAKPVIYAVAAVKDAINGRVRMEAYIGHQVYSAPDLHAPLRELAKIIENTKNKTDKAGILTEYVSYLLTAKTKYDKKDMLVIDKYSDFFEGVKELLEKHTPKKTDGAKKV